MNYNIHEAINYRSHRKGLVNSNSLNFKFKEIQRNVKVGIVYPLEINSYPSNGYNLYYPNVTGKKHSNYPKN